MYTRDDFACQWCGDNRGSNLNADHIKPFAVILSEKNISSIDEALKCEDLWDLSNGRTLCEECHKKTDTYGNRSLESPILSTNVIAIQDDVALKYPSLTFSKTPSGNFNKRMRRSCRCNCDWCRRYCSYMKNFVRRMS